MLHVDVFTAYLICGVSSLVGAAMLRIAETDDARLRAALRVCGWGFVTLGLGLLPASLGSDAGHPAAQLMLAIGSAVGIALVARGVGQLQGRPLPVPRMVALSVAVALVCTLAWLAGPLHFGLVYAFVLAGVASLLNWLGRGFVSSPRDLVERGLGLSILLISASSWMRAGFALVYEGPWKPNMLYLPAPLEPFIAALYGVMPMVMSTLLLSLVNARLRQQLRSRAITDELTGLMTRRAMGELAPVAIATARQRHRVLAVLMLDLDHFKRVNDTHGHAAGDRVLRVAAQTLQAHMRHDALLARYGGEEFVAVVPVHDSDAARLVAERLRQAIEAADWSAATDAAPGVTVSVGLALVGDDGNLEDTLRLADRALYKAKHQGRNNVQMAEA